MLIYQSAIIGNGSSKADMKRAKVCLSNVIIVTLPTEFHFSKCVLHFVDQLEIHGQFDCLLHDVLQKMRVRKEAILFARKRKDPYVPFGHETQAMSNRRNHIHHKDMTKHR